MPGLDKTGPKGEGPGTGGGFGQCKPEDKKKGKEPVGRGQGGPGRGMGPGGGRGPCGGRGPGRKRWIKKIVNQ